MTMTQCKPIPRWVGASVERVLAARGRPARLKRVFDSCSVPLLAVDDHRRYVDANIPARLSFRQSLAELRRLRIDDLTPAEFLPEMEKAWARLTETGCVAGRYEVASPTGTTLEVSYLATADAMRGLYLIAFAPMGWPEDELIADPPPTDVVRALTPREREVLGLVADGHSNTMIATELVVRPATVKSHLANIYEKLDARDRAGAVAKAMRLGLID